MLSVGLRPHIYCHILVRLILCARMSAKYLFSNVERGSIPPHTLPHSHAPHSTARLALYKGLRPLLSVHDVYPLLYAPLLLAFWYNFLHCGLRILAMVFRKFDAPSWFVSAIQSVSVFSSPCWTIPFYVHSIYADEFFKWVYSPFLTLFILVRHFFQRVYLDGPSFRSFSHMPLIHFIFSSGIIPAFFYSMEFINIVYALPLAVFTDGFQFLDLCLRGLRPSPRGLRPSCYDTPAISYSSWDYCFFATIGFFSS